jgi:hypothetical protein
MTGEQLPLLQPAENPQPPRRTPECYGDVCVTCSDEAVAVRVVELLDDELALVDTEAGVEEVSVALVSARVGDTILVHAKEAIAVVQG